MLNSSVIFGLLPIFSFISLQTAMLNKALSIMTLNPSKTRSEVTNARPSKTHSSPVIASFQDSDERELARIGYKQVCARFALKEHSWSRFRSFAENLQNGRRSLMQFRFLASWGLFLLPLVFQSWLVVQQQPCGHGLLALAWRCVSHFQVAHYISSKR